jgi:predicted DNA-binding transcriptional regulator YafY
MTKRTSTKKAWRLLQIQRRLFRNPRGYRSSELAEIFNVDKRTINRDLLDLQSEPFCLPLVQEDAPDWRWHIMKDARFTLPPLQLSLQEGAALYLAARLLDRTSDEHNPFVNRALSALANVLPAEIGDHVQKVVTGRPDLEDDTFAQVFETVTLGWATGRVVQIWHQSSSSKNVHDYRFHPYLIEASAVGFSAYAIGWASWFDEVHTFKLERITKAELTEDVFEIPKDFDGVSLLNSAWGIAYTNPGETPEQVKLRFPPGRITRRVKESQWHPTQTIEETPDGGCILTVEVGHPWEMKPFIRGWGPDCEVLEPEWLREEIAAESKQVAKLYY